MSRLEKSGPRVNRLEGQTRRREVSPPSLINVVLPLAVISDGLGVLSFAGHEPETGGILLGVGLLLHAALFLVNRRTEQVKK